ncbi:MAG TPA: cyclic nucleotide-binding domain-containing protein [Verrucomicrobiae bacterium]
MKTALVDTGSTDLMNRLRAHPFLKGMNESHLLALVDCAMPCSFVAGQKIFAEGDVANRFYLLESGEVTLFSEGSPHEHVPVQTLAAGDVLGWSWLFPPYYWHFSAEAKTQVDAIFFYGTRLRERCEQDPALGYEIMKRVTEIVIARLQKTRQQFLKT